MLKDPTAFRNRFQAWKNGLKVYDKGKAISDEKYVSIMERVAKDNNAEWNRDRKLHGEKQLTVDQELFRLLNDNSYDYRGYYNKYPNGKGNALNHWTDEFKTAYHPTFSVESTYSGKKSQYNPQSVLGGQWSDRTDNAVYVPAWGQKLQTPSFGSNLNFFDGGKDTQESKLFNYIERATRYIADHEGFVDHVYEDPHASQEIAKKRGKWSDNHKKYVIPTAGYGWTAKEDLHDWTKEEAYERLKKDIVKYDNHWRKVVPNWDNMPEEHRIAIIDLGHQGGLGVLNKMPKFKEALMSGDKNAGNYISFAAHQTKNRNNDRIALWNSPQKYKNKEFKNVAKEVTDEMSQISNPIDALRMQKPILPVDRVFDPNVPESISLRNTVPTHTQQVIAAIDNQIALNRLLKTISLENLTPWASAPQKDDIVNGFIFDTLSIPKITNR